MVRSCPCHHFSDSHVLLLSFDPHFNAITGLNGSGKSNILDSICFVLGITNLSQVRAGNLSELVYKQGQAGVNKASVTIIFNNEDEAGSPVGYEQCPEVTVTRQVLLGGKSKYMINGRNSPAGQVQNLFHSVQLNVNNPHFLIMQGRITKVLNMKPNEILGMVEEAAGTRMYETKRVAAIKTIDKKQAKVDELNSVLSEEITPTLERLRGEKQNYLKWSRNNADIERIERFVVASNFMRAQQALENNKEGSDEMEAEVEALEAEAEEYQQQIAEKEAESSALSLRLRGEFDNSHTKLKQQEEKESKDLVKVTSAWQNSKELTKNAENDLATSKKVLEETKDSLVTKEQEAAAESESIQDRLNAKVEAEKELGRLTSDFQNLSAGLASSQGEEGLTLPDQIAKAHSDSKTAEAKVKQATMKMKHLAKEIAVSGPETSDLYCITFHVANTIPCFQTVEKNMKKEQKSAEDLNKKRDKAMEKQQLLKGAVDELAFNEEEFATLEQEKDQLSASVSEWSDLVETLTAQLGSRLAFNYSDPVRGFDRSKVKGIVAKLIQVKKSPHATALEVVAGGKLYQVVVDEAITGKAILDRGKLERRVTIIPLDKIRPRRVTDSAAQKAADIAQSIRAEAWPAIELVGFDEEVRSAMEYVFGSSIVVDGSKAANQICDSTKTRTVTLEGDVYDPSGTISGGSKNNLGTTLSELTKLAVASSKLLDGRKRLSEIKSKLGALKKASIEFDKLHAKLELSEAELKGIQKHLSQTTYGVLEEKLNSMSEELVAAEQEYEAMQKEQSEKWDLYHELKEKEVELTQQRENRLGQIENAVKEAKKDAGNKDKAAREAQSALQTLSLELECLNADVLAAEEGVASARQALKEASDEEDNKQIKVGEVKALYDDAKASLAAFDNQLTKFSNELSEIKHMKSALAKKAEACVLKAKKLSVTISRIQKERHNAEKVVADLLKNNIWIESEKSAFGVAGGDYDFVATDPSDKSRQLHALKSEQEALVSENIPECIFFCCCKTFPNNNSILFLLPSEEQENQQKSYGNDRKS